MRLTLLFFSAFVAFACSPKKAAPNKFSDPALVKIYDLKDRRLSDSLLVWLYSKDPIYRREAALAFGSVQDSLVSLALGSALLEDTDIEVQRNAAFSLGQTGGTMAVNALIPGIQNKNRGVVREVLEALGKTIKASDLKILTALQSNDSLLQEGLAKGFYHLGLRKLADSIVTRKQAAFLANKYSYKTRLAASNYFGRSSKVEGKGFDNKLIAAAQQDISVDVRMAAVSGFRHLNPTEAIFILGEIIKTDKDYRVRVAAVRAVQNFTVPEAHNLILTALQDSIDMVQIAASEVWRNKSKEFAFKNAGNEILLVKNTRVKSNLYGALFKVNPHSTIIEDITKAYTKGSLYYKAQLLSALGEAGPDFEEKAFEFISIQLFKKSNEKVLLTSAASALVSINSNPDTKISSERFLSVYTEAIIQSTDIAVTGTFASALMNPSLHYKDHVKDLTFLYNAMAKLKLPEDIESLQPLEFAIAYLEGREKPVPLKNKFNHPINWDLVKAIPADRTLEIRTTKGTILLKLLVEEAPGSVVNFDSLVQAKYYDGKLFHRVVPNFVIQTGCNRGDGYGGEDYSIRSEFSLRRYNTGAVGMASAGKDTEGTQWFITHSPTPHLDGRYTIFAETLSGMEVVDKIEVGDKIISVSIPESKK